VTQWHAQTKIWSPAEQPGWRGAVAVSSVLVMPMTKRGYCPVCKQDNLMLTARETELDQLPEAMVHWLCPKGHVAEGP
jgi:hypothetical protein